MSKLSDLQNETRTCEVQRDGKVVLTFTYYPLHYTPLYEEEMEAKLEAVTGRQIGRILAESLEPILADWDLEEDDGTRIPLDLANLKRLGTPLLTEIQSAIMEDLSSPKKSAMTSESG